MAGNKVSVTQLNSISKHSAMAALKALTLLLVLVAAVSAQQGGQGGYGYGHHEEYHHYPKYVYEYGVKDPKTHDIHSQKEHRDGDKTEGVYSLHEADGTIRTVKYFVNGKSGWNAHVDRAGHAKHPHGGESWQQFNLY